MILKFILAVLVIVVVAGVLVIGLISALVIFAAGVIVIEHYRVNQEQSPRPPRAWRKRQVQDCDTNL